MELAIIRTTRVVCFYCYELLREIGSTRGGTVFDVCTSCARHPANKEEKDVDYSQEVYREMLDGD